MEQISHVPMWFLAGEKEHNYKKYAQSMYNRLKGLGGETKLTLVPGVGHPIQFTWVSDKYDMFDWLAGFENQMMEVGGMIADLSKYQGDIDWGQAFSSLDFAILRSSVGVKKDERYAEYVSGCTRYKVPYHAYHYIKATDETEARNEAKVMADATAGTSPLFYVIDAEYDGIKADRARAICEAFEDGLRHYIGSGIRVAVYIGHHLYKSWALDYSRYAYVWIPRYGSNDGKPQTPPDYPCDLWQYTSKGKLPGVSGNVDLNKLTGTKPLEFFITNPTDQPDTPEPSNTDGGDSTMFTGKQLAEYCEEIYQHKDHWAYWYGTYGNQCTLSKYESKKKQYPEHYGSSRKSGYMKDIEQGRRCADCVGMIKSFFWTGNRYDTDPKYGTNGCPDKSANGLFDMCKETGDIKTIPDIPGIVVWKSGHIGVYVWNGYTVEMKGFDYDCRRNKVTDGPWKKWGKLPMLSYDEPKPEPSEYRHVLVTGGSVNIRSGPGTDKKDIGTAHKGDLLPYQGVTEPWGGRDWYLIIWENQNGWISSKYSKLVE
jgi:GH25 family lysozyme M1 (1,4-beta-N-acetylmuramidase)